MIGDDESLPETPPSGRPVLVGLDTEVDQAHRDDLAERAAWTTLATAADEALSPHLQKVRALRMARAETDDSLRAARRALAPSLKLTA